MMMRRVWAGKKAAAIATLVGLLSFSASAQDEQTDFPHHDVEGDCRAQVDNHFGSVYRNSDNSIVASAQDSWRREYNFCVDNEQSHYDYLKATWDQVPDEIKTKCLAMNNPQPVLYYSLSSCVQTLLGDYDATHSLHKFQP